MGDPVEGDQVVLARAVDLDVAHEDHLVVVDVEGRREDVLRTLVKAREELAESPSHPGRCLA
jgi:hypothetical protein